MCEKLIFIVRSPFCEGQEKLSIDSLECSSPRKSLVKGERFSRLLKRNQSNREMQRLWAQLRYLNEIFTVSIQVCNIYTQKCHSFINMLIILALIKSISCRCILLCIDYIFKKQICIATKLNVNNFSVSKREATPSFNIRKPGTNSV